MRQPVFVRAVQMTNQLFYGDNLDVLRDHRKIRDESVDLCYIDPPFNSKRNYFQIYNNVGKDDVAQAQAFIDTWTWNDLAIAGYQEITLTRQGDYTRQTIELMKGLKAVLGENGLLAYLISMTQRVNEIQRVLKPTGSFYLHCDPTASHYLKLVLDSVFCARGGDFKNEVVWAYKRWSAAANKFQGLHDVVFFYSKGKEITFNKLYEEYTEGTLRRWKGIKRKTSFTEDKKLVQVEDTKGEKGSNMGDVWGISILNSQAKERLGYPTQKPEALLERIIQASSNEGDTVLDAFCGCGTTVAVAQRLRRNWIGIDITYQSIAVILKRLEDSFGAETVDAVQINGIPRDVESARALANKKDDRLRKEFEKWAVMTYSKNRATINEKKGADKGVDGIGYFATGKDTTKRVIFQVKSGKVQRNDIATLNSDRQREDAEIAVLITLEDATKAMRDEAKVAGVFHHDMWNRDDPRVQIVTVREMIEDGKRLDLPLSEVLKTAASATTEDQALLL